MNGTRPKLRWTMLAR